MLVPRIGVIPNGFGVRYTGRIFGWQIPAKQGDNHRTNGDIGDGSGCGGSNEAVVAAVDTVAMVAVVAKVVAVVVGTATSTVAVF